MIKTKIINSDIEVGKSRGEKLTLGSHEHVTITTAFDGFWHFRNEGPGNVNLGICNIGAGPRAGLSEVELTDCRLLPGQIAVLRGSGPFNFQSIDHAGAIVVIEAADSIVWRT